MDLRLEVIWTVATCLLSCTALACSCSGHSNDPTTRADYGAFCASWDATDERPWCAVPAEDLISCGGKQHVFESSPGKFWSHTPCREVPAGAPPPPPPPPRAQVQAVPRDTAVTLLSDVRARSTRGGSAGSGSSNGNDIGGDSGSTPTTGTGTRIPALVHYVLTDPGTRFFDWTCYAGMLAARERIGPSTIVVHLLNGLEPYGQWWAAAKAMTGVRVELRSFARNSVPMELNGVAVTKPAHISDLKRFEVLYQEGGIYLDTDHIVVSDFKSLLQASAGHTSVFGRQAQNEKGHQVAIGCIATVPRNPLFKAMLAEMKARFDGGWATHSIDMVDAFLSPEHAAATGPDGHARPPPDRSVVPHSTLVLPYPRLFPFGWQRELLWDGPASLFRGNSFNWTTGLSAQFGTAAAAGGRSSAGGSAGPVYSMHLFHSQSEGVSRYIGCSDIRKQSTNFARGLQLALGQSTLSNLCTKLDEYEYYTGASHDRKMKEHVQQQLQLQRRAQRRR